MTQTWRRGIAALLALAAAAAVTAGAASPAQAVAHGRTVPDGSYRFSAKLTMTGLPTGDGGTRDSSCSGALVAPRWVLTAGHCFHESDGTRADHPVAEHTTATVGRADLAGKSGHVVKVIGVRQSGTADVALAELDTAITDITPIAVATSAPAPGAGLRLTGYGLTDDNAGRTATRLQTGDFTVTAVDGSTIAVTGRSPRPDTSACKHDSGGPYFTTGSAPVLVAVVSEGPACPHAGADTAARVDPLAGWIARTTKTQGDGAVSWFTAVIVLLLLACAAAAVLLLRRAPAHRRKSGHRPGRPPQAHPADPLPARQPASGRRP